MDTAKLIKQHKTNPGGPAIDLLECDDGTWRVRHRCNGGGRWPDGETHVIAPALQTDTGRHTVTITATGVTVTDTDLVEQRRQARDARDRAIALAFTPTERALVELHEHVSEFDPQGVDELDNPVRWASYHTGRSRQVAAELQRRYELLGLDR